MHKEEKQSEKSLRFSIAMILILSLCLGITTYALVTYKVSVKDNYFQTGNVDIDLNNGKPVINENEFLFEPGMTVKKDFYIKNNSSWSVYYKLYFGDVSGGLKDVLEISIYDKDELLLSGHAEDLDRRQVKMSDELAAGEKKDLTIYFHFPEEEGNESQEQTLSFRLSADAVQTKNNPDKVFE